MKIQYKEDPWNNKNHNVSKMLLKPMSNQFPESENSEDFCSSDKLFFNLKRGARKLTGENLKPVWAEISTIS